MGHLNTHEYSYTQNDKEDNDADYSPGNFLSCPFPVGLPNLGFYVAVVGVIGIFVVCGNLRLTCVFHLDWFWYTRTRIEERVVGT